MYCCAVISPSCNSLLSIAVASSKLLLCPPFAAVYKVLDLCFNSSRLSEIVMTLDVLTVYNQFINFLLLSLALLELASVVKLLLFIKASLLSIELISAPFYNVLKLSVSGSLLLECNNQKFPSSITIGLRLRTNSSFSFCINL